MANSADRLYQWVTPQKMLGVDTAGNTIGPGYTDAQLQDYRDNWGIDGWILAIGRPWLMGGSVRFTGDAAAVGSTSEWAVQRAIRDQNIGPRCAALGQKIYITQWGRNELTGHGSGGYFESIWDDAAWANIVVPSYSGVAGACNLYGLQGIFFDWENYPKSDGTTPTWVWSSWNEGHTEAETRAKVKQRGAQLVTGLVAAHQNHELAAYFVRLPWSEYAWATSNSDGTSFLNGQYNSWVQIDLISGFFSTRQLKAFHMADAQHYKFVGPRIDTWTKISMGPMTDYMSNYAGFDWDYAASRWYNSHFVWIDPGESPSEPLRSVAQVADQLDQASIWCPSLSGIGGGEFYNYAHHWGETGTGAFDYGPYKPGMVAASAPRTVDSSAPTITVTSSTTVGSNQVIQGSSYDTHFIHHIQWKNNRSGLTGMAKHTFVDTSGRPMQPFWSGHNSTFGVFDVDEYQEWRMDWTATVPLDQANDSITITAFDIHGQTAAVNVGGLPPPPSPGGPIVTVNTATNVGQSTATLSGTVNPQGAATTAHFEYGPTTAYGTSTTTQNLGSGTTAVIVSQALTGLTPGQTYHFRLVASNSAGSTSSSDQTFATPSSPPPAGTYAQLVLNTPGIVAYWRLNEGSGSVLDAAGQNVGTPTGGVTRQITGIGGSEGDLAMRFDGTTGYISVPSATALNLGDGPYSLEAWFRHTTAGRSDAIFDKGTGAYHLYIDTDNKLKSGKADFAWGVESNVAITDTNYHHVVVTYDGTSWRIFIDGIDRTGPTSDLALADGTTVLGIGADASGGPAHFFAGDLDELAIYNAVLTPAKVLEHWQTGSSTVPKVVILGQAQELDEPQLITLVGGVQLGAATFALRKTAGGSRSGGADRLRAATTRAVIRIALGQATETDIAQPLTKRKTRAVTQILETDLAQPLLRGRRVTLGLATETDTVMTMARRRQVGLNTETDVALPMRPRKTVVLGQAVGG